MGNDGWKPQLYKGLAEFALLALLRAEPRYGLELLASLREQAGLGISDGAIYPLLHRVETAGLIVAEWRMDPGVSHPRKYYSLTAAGHAAFEQMVADWAEIAGRLNALVGASS